MPRMSAIPVSIAVLHPRRDETALDYSAT
jgi:hypothetical protein